MVPQLHCEAPAAPGPDPIQHLRDYNNYLAPKLGLLSLDTWTLVATVGRNMFLNWLVFVPLLLAALMAPRLLLSLGRLGETFFNFLRPVPMAQSGPTVENYSRDERAFLRDVRFSIS